MVFLLLKCNEKELVGHNFYRCPYDLGRVVRGGQIHVQNASHVRHQTYYYVPIYSKSFSEKSPYRTSTDKSTYVSEDSIF